MKENKELSFQPGRLYFMEDDDDTGSAEIYDLTALGDDKAAEILTRALNEAKRAQQAR